MLKMMVVIVVGLTTMSSAQNWTCVYCRLNGSGQAAFVNHVCTVHRNEPAVARSGECPAVPSTPPPRPSTPAPALPRPTTPGDSNVRYLDFGSRFKQSSTRPIDFSADPIYRSWVPDFVQRMLNADYSVHGTVEFEGPVWIQRGSRRVLLTSADRHLQLMAGDIFITGPAGHLVFTNEYGHEAKIGPNTYAGVGVSDEACLTYRRSDARNTIGWHLIRGTLYWLSTGANVRSQCKMLTTLTHGTFVLGTAFSATVKQSIEQEELTIAVTSGEVVVDGTISVKAGKAQIFVSGNGRLDWTVENNCTRPIFVRFFDRATGTQWPADVAKAWTAEPGASVRRLLACPLNATICYGAATERKDLSWGVGLDGRLGCKDCCRTCTATAAPIANSLVCRASTVR